QVAVARDEEKAVERLEQFRAALHRVRLFEEREQRMIPKPLARRALAVEYGPRHGRRILADKPHAAVNDNVFLVAFAGELVVLPRREPRLAAAPLHEQRGRLAGLGFAAGKK